MKSPAKSPAKSHNPSHPQAIAAIRAAKNCATWGRFATLGFLRKRAIPLPLFTLAVILHRSHEHGL